MVGTAQSFENSLLPCLYHLGVHVVQVIGFIMTSYSMSVVLWYREARVYGERAREQSDSESTKGLFNELATRVRSSRPLGHSPASSSSFVGGLPNSPTLRGRSCEIA
ncbi:hypothetical protein U1Q18_051724, partial [Sarracenia purpurea var. burkii]